MRKIATIAAVLSMWTASAQNNEEMNFHSFTMTNLAGEEVDLSTFAGKKLLVVNVASECGYTKQYEQMQAVYDEFGGDHFEIIAFPANNFGGQEPGTATEIQEFCSTKFGVTFTMMDKISVKGDDQHELYKWLTTKELNGSEDVDMIWNFQKFLIDEDGNFDGWVEPQVLPDDAQIIDWIKS